MSKIVKKKGKLMAKRPRREKAEPGKYEGQRFLNYEEAEDYLGIKHATLFSYINDLEIETIKFKRNRRRFLAIADVKRIEDAKDSPWLAGAAQHKNKHRTLSTPPQP